MTDADAFFNFTTLDGNGVIGVELYDGEWSSFDKFKLGVVVVRDVYKDLIVKICVLSNVCWCKEDNNE